MSKILMVTSGLKHTQSFLEPYTRRLNSFLTRKGATVDIRTAQTFDERTFFSYDQVIFVFINTLESIPSSTLEIFEKLENQKKTNQEIYAMIVCDEYEPEKCNHSKRIIEKWCEKENLLFKGSFHLGSGLVIMKSPRRFSVVSQIEKFASKIILHQDVQMSFTLFSLNGFIRLANQYWHYEMLKQEISKK